MLSNWDEETLKEIEQIAYFKWVDAGRPEEMQTHFWQLAEKEMLGKTIDVEEVVEISYRKPQKKVTYAGTDHYYGSSGLITITNNDASNTWHSCTRVAYDLDLGRTYGYNGSSHTSTYQPQAVQSRDYIDLSQVVNKGNSRYKVYDRDLREVLSDNAIKDMMAEEDRKI